MGYYEAIESNGVKIKEYKEFGSYQGDWFAILENGRIVKGSYGSCSGCDAFQAEFDWDDKILEKQKDGKYYRNNNFWDSEEEITEEEALKINQAYQDKLRNFGKSYLDDAMTLDEAIAIYKSKSEEEYAWDDDKEIYDWLKSLKND